MGQETKIAWCDSTFNPWIGCTKVSPGCANCYAEALMHRWGKDLWGPGKPRQRTSAAHWKLPLRWEKASARHMFCECDCGNREFRHWDDRLPPGGLSSCSRPECMALPETEMSVVRPRVFCGSLCDWLDPEVPIEWLADLLDLIRLTPHLDWLMLTKRPELWMGRLGAVLDHLSHQLQERKELTPEGQYFDAFSKWLDDWRLSGLMPGHGWNPPANVRIGVTVENQEMADERIPELLKIPAWVRFLSCEPLLGPMQFLPNGAFTEKQQFPVGFETWTEEKRNTWFMRTARATYMSRIDSGIDWVICGGESGPKARPMHPDWARSLRDQCKAAGVPFFFKQQGEFIPLMEGGLMITTDKRYTLIAADGSIVGTNHQNQPKPFAMMCRVGKARAGHMLDGVEIREFPRVESEVRDA